MLEHDESCFGDGLTRRLSVTSHDMMLSGLKWSRSDVHLFVAYLSTMYLFRRRNHAPLERDVLRHDVISFGMEPLTKRSQGEALLSAAATV